MDLTWMLIDPVYSQWKHLKDLSHTDNSQHHDFLSEPSPLATPSSISPLKEVLQVALLKNKKGKTSVTRTGTCTLHMPKHMTGNAFIDMMKEKDRKKQEEIEKKEDAS